MRLFLALVLIIAPSLAFAAPRYERSIDVSRISSVRPVFLTIPEEIMLYHSPNSLRILREDTIIPLKMSVSQRGEFGGVIDSVDLCSVEGAGKVAVLYDGDRTTFVRPDPLRDPEYCTLDISFSVPVRVHGVSLGSDQIFEHLAIEARSPSGEYIKLGEQKNNTSIQFSTVVTDALKLFMTYDMVPALNELTLQGSIPARILFEADPSASYTFVYGDDVPPELPEAPQSLFAKEGTPFVTLGTEKMREEDSDEDGLLAAKDNCPFVSNPHQEDNDNDGVGDVCDNAPGVVNSLQADRDHDGVGDRQDNCPSIFNPDQRDEDINGIGYACDDKDGDGVMNSRDNCPGLSNSNQQDMDGNDIGDACEFDRDSDGFPDEEDNCRGVANPDQNDRDKDGIGDTCDSCPDIKNPSQEDKNENDIGDACEAAIQDPDGDGVNNNSDNCPTIPNPNQADADGDGRGDLCDNCPTLQNPNQKDSDKDGQGDVCTDVDGDGFLPHIDNCPTIANSDQSDKNNNGRGDACEDEDGDGVVNAIDNCKYKSNRNQADKDADGIGDVCDEEDSRFSEKYPWVMWTGMIFIVLVLLSFVIRMVIRIQKDQVDAQKTMDTPED